MRSNGEAFVLGFKASLVLGMKGQLGCRCQEGSQVCTWSLYTGVWVATKVGIWGSTNPKVSEGKPPWSVRKMNTNYKLEGNQEINGKVTQAWWIPVTNSNHVATSFFTFTLMILPPFGTFFLFPSLHVEILHSSLRPSWDWSPFYEPFCFQVSQPQQEDEPTHNVMKRRYGGTRPGCRALLEVLK